MHPQTELCRCFIHPVEVPPKPKRGRKRRTWRDVILPGIVEALRPYAHTSIVFDVETTVDAHSGQVAKIVYWQEHGLRYVDRCALFAEGLLTPEVTDVCFREGVAYNRLTCTPEDTEIIKAHAAKHGLCCMEMQDFITKIFYRQAWLNKFIPEPKLLLGHNVVFDVGALSHHTGQSRDPKYVRRSVVRYLHLSPNRN